MRLNPDNTAFGRHETFALRYGWLTKGFHALKADQKVFESDDATVRLGVGKNMVSSIRFWLRACQLIDGSSNKATELGNLIFDPTTGLDPYLEDEATIWLLHWLLATNPQQATTWFWFFNKFHKTNFSAKELLEALKLYVSENVKFNVSPSTLKSDISVLIRMYTKSAATGKLPAEEALDSPFSMMGLVSNNHDNLNSIPHTREQLPTEIFAFSVTKFFEDQGKMSIPLEEIMSTRSEHVAPGAIFRLDESDVVNKLEAMINFIPNMYEIRDVAGQMQVFRIGRIDAKEYIKKYYLIDYQEVVL